MNRSWVTENSNFVFSHRQRFKNGLGEAMYHQIYAADTLVIKIYISAEINLFCHVCYNTNGLKKAKNIIRTIFVARISGPNRQLSWILRLLLESKLFVTNLLSLTTTKT